MAATTKQTLLYLKLAVLSLPNIWKGGGKKARRSASFLPCLICVIKFPPPPSSPNHQRWCAKMEAQMQRARIAYTFSHVWHPICMLTRRLATKFLRRRLSRKFIKGALLVGLSCVTGFLHPLQKKKKKEFNLFLSSPTRAVGLQGILFLLCDSDILEMYKKNGKRKRMTPLPPSSSSTSSCHFP